MQMEFSLDNIREAARKLLDSTDEHIFLFYGEMGAGKTTFIQNIMRKLGVKEAISSPTFSLVNEYVNSLGERLYHFDFYRIESIEEALDIGVEEYFDSGSYCFIEWPEKIEGLLPIRSFSVYLEVVNEETRRWITR